MIWGRLRAVRSKGFLVSIAALAFVGCGLSDYEERMDHQRKRASIFDDEVKYLADPISPPMLPLVKGKPPMIAWPFEVHLRAPIFVRPKRPSAAPPKKGEKFDPTADPEPDHTFAVQNLRLTAYAGEDKNFGMLVGAAKLLAKNPPGKIVANEMTAAEFKGRLPGALLAYYQKLRAGRPTTIVFPQVFKGEEDRMRPLTTAGELAPIIYEKMVLHEDPTTEKLSDPIGFIAYYWGDEKLGRQMAIIYQVPAELAADKAQFPTRKTRALRYSGPVVSEAIKFSLKSLATDDDAKKKRKDFAAKKL